MPQMAENATENPSVGLQNRTVPPEGDSIQRKVNSRSNMHKDRKIATLLGRLVRAASFRIH